MLVLFPLLLVLSQFSQSTASSHNHPMSCRELFDICVEDLEKAASRKQKGEKDYRNCFHEDKFLYFLYYHDKNIQAHADGEAFSDYDYDYHEWEHGWKFDKLDEEVQEMWTNVYDSVGNPDEKCKAEWLGWGAMNIDLHDLFLFDNTALVRQLCSNVQEWLGVQCLPSIKFAYTSEDFAYEEDDALDRCIEKDLATLTTNRLKSVLDPAHLHIDVKVENYPCIPDMDALLNPLLTSDAEGSSSSGEEKGCRFITNEISCDEIDENFSKQDAVKEEIQDLVQETEFKNLVGSKTGSIDCEPTPAPTPTHWHYH